MQYLGNYTEDYATLNFKFSTHKADGTPITLAGTPAVKVYKANSTSTETATGVTLTVDFDSVTGLHNVLIDLSADVFYAVGNDYSVVITTGTVDSVSVVGTVLAHFSIENRFNEVDLVKILGTALTETGAGYLAAALKKFLDVATPVFTAASVNQGADNNVILANASKGLVKVYDDMAKDSTVSKPGTAQTITANQAVNVAQWGGQNIATPAINGEPVVTLASTQAAYAPAKAGDKMDLIDAPNATALLAVANKVEAEIIDETDSEKVLKAITDKIASVNPDLSGLTLLAIASAVRTNLAAELANIDAKISTRSSHSAADVKTAIEAAGSSIASILEDTGTTLPASLSSIVTTISAIGLGTAPVAHLYTVTTTGGVYCADCLVIMSTDSAMANPIHKGTTDELGQVTFYPNLPAGTTVYLWKFKSGVNFVNPTTEVIHS
jgi:hypothetical protein